MNAAAHSLIVFVQINRQNQFHAAIKAANNKISYLDKV
jgi:hypothetical protein